MKKLLSAIITAGLLMQPLTGAAAQDNVYTITVPEQTYQSVKGWGVYPNSVSSGFLNKVAAHKALYHDLGITQFRIELRGQAGDGDGNLVPDVYGQFVSNIKLAADNGIDTYSVHIWSPPAQMKDNNSISGLRDDGKGARLLPENEQKFCDWIVKAFKGVEEQGLKAPIAVSFQNEPEVLKEYQSCGYDMEQYARVAKLLRKTLDAAGYGAIQILGPEGGGYRSNSTWLGKGFSALEEDEEYANAIGAFCSHSYPLKQGSPDSDLAEWLSGCDKYPEKDRWQSEYCNGNSYGTTQVDRTMIAISTLNSDMVWGRNNYWIWWLGFDTRYSIDNNYQEVLLGGDGVSSVVKSSTFNILSKIYNNVPVGAKVKKPVSDDPELKTEFSLTNDMSAYISGKGVTLVVVNRSKEAKTYNVEGLTGKSAVVSSVSNTFEDMKDVAQKNIEGGMIKGLKLPPESVNVIVTKSKDMSPPNVSVDLSAYWQRDDGVYVVRDEKIKLKGYADEKANIEINRSLVSLDDDFGFETTLDAAQAKIVRIISCDMNKNYAEPQTFKFEYNRTFVDAVLTDFPDKTNKRELPVTGRMNVTGTVYVNGEEYNTDENGYFEGKVTLSDGDNEITMSAEDRNGNKSEPRTYRVFCDSEPPQITLADGAQTTEDFEYIVSGSVSEEADLEVNGMAVPLREDKTFSTKVRLADGANSISVKAADAYGNESTEQINVTFTRTDNTPHETASVTYAKKIQGNINVDGDLSEWKIDNKMTKVLTGEPNNIVNFAAMWNEQYLYVAAQVKDDRIFADGDQVYQNDTIEIFLNPGNEKIQKYMEHDKQLFIGYAKNGKELYVNGGSYPAGRRETEDGYTVEMAIPWAELGTEPSMGKVIGFDMTCDDKDKPGDRESILAWAGTNDNWKDTSGFGNMHLVGENDVIYVDKQQETAPESGAADGDAELSVGINGMPAEQISDFSEYNGSDAEIYIGGQPAELDPSAYVDGGCVMVPVRALCEKLGIGVMWDGMLMKAVLDYGGTAAEIIPGSNAAAVGQTEMTNLNIQEKEDRLFVPVEVFIKILAE